MRIACESDYEARSHIDKLFVDGAKKSGEVQRNRDVEYFTGEKGPGGTNKQMST